MRSSLRIENVLAVMLWFVIGCAAQATEEPVELASASLSPGEDDLGDDVPAPAADDDAPASASPRLDGVTEMRTLANLNLRDDDGAILLVIPKGAIVTLLAPEARAGFYRVSLNGIDGRCSAKYLEAIEPAAGRSKATDGEIERRGTDDVDVNGPPSPENALARARPAMGFSYYWGGGAWLEGGPTTSSRGSCSGSCPSCTHAGKYGADCSGLVAKAWQLGPKELSVNGHPFGTVHFASDAKGRWTTIPRASLRAGDALVYNDGGHGHIVLYEKGDGWGSPTVLECRGCAAGCVRDARSFGSAYHAIRRDGF